MLGRAAQRHRVNRVINFAQAHLGETLDLERLADVACLSKFHFTRVFSTHFGETPVEFLWRCRLETAARALAFLPGKPITDIALDYGFSGPDAFSRAFRQRFRAAPRAFRAANPWSITSLPADQRREAGIGRPIVKGDADVLSRVPVRIEERPEYRVAYVRHIGPYSDANGGITAAFSTLFQWARRHDLWRDDSGLIGLCPSNARLTPPAYCLYDACLPVSPDVLEDEIVSIQVIPGGIYAVLPVVSPAAKLCSIWEWFTASWLPLSGATYELASCYEFVPSSNGRPGRPETGVELCLRIRPCGGNWPVWSGVHQDRNSGQDIALLRPYGRIA